MLDLNKFKEHVGSHVNFPTTKAGILEGCRQGEFVDDVIQAAESRLPDETYQTAGKALKDLQSSLRALLRRPGWRDHRSLHLLFPVMCSLELDMSTGRGQRPLLIPPAQRRWVAVGLSSTSSDVVVSSYN